MARLILVSLVACVGLFAGCKDDSKAKVQLSLDWKPEPEFGGFYAAQQNGDFTKNGLDVEIKPFGAGAPTWQLVATGKTEFATTAADQVLIARSQGADVVAIFTVYQTSPQGIMVRKSRGFTKLADVFANPGTLAAENNAWLQYCRNKFAPVTVKLTGYTGGVAGFLAKDDFAQQCFVFAEPITARKQDPASDPQTFLIAESGYNPYTTVVITSGETLRKNPARVKAMAEACNAGWRTYLDDPAAANKVMNGLNPDMDLDTFTQGAAAQKPLIETEETKSNGLGAMTAERWTTLGQQLVELKVIPTAPPAAECFIDVKTLK